MTEGMHDFLRHTLLFMCHVSDLSVPDHLILNPIGPAVRLMSDRSRAAGSKKRNSQTTATEMTASRVARLDAHLRILTIGIDQKSMCVPFLSSMCEEVVLV